MTYDFSNISDQQLDIKISFLVGLLNVDNLDHHYERSISERIILLIEEQDHRNNIDYLTQDQTADLLGNDNAHYVWNGDDLYYLAHPEQDDRNY
jgi:hypothetical protein